MEIKIQWSDLAAKQLTEIYEYYALKASPELAMKIITRITERVNILYGNPLAGQVEELLLHYPEEFRYLVESHYKIIYWQERNVITIAMVFDSRQNPLKIQDI